MKIIQLAVVSMAAAYALPSQASSLVYEGFNYAVADGETMNGVTTNATGIIGDYTQGQSLPGLGTALYTATGLSFGSNFMPVTGGALTMSIASSTTTRSTQLNAALDTGVVTGTVWTSYLFSYGSIGTQGATGQIRINGDPFASTNAHLAVLADGANLRSNGVGYNAAIGSAVTNAPAQILSITTTYLALAKFDNLGTVGESGSAEMWVFTEAGYNDWLNLGLGSEEELTTYAVAGSHVLNFATTTEAISKFDDTQFLSFATSNSAPSSANAETVTFDELRWGTELGDVVFTTVPEPTATLLFLVGAGLGGLVWLRRRASPGGNVAPCLSTKISTENARPYPTGEFA